MAVQLQLRRGTESENAAFVGAQGELTYSTDTKSMHIHDGETVGGFPVDVVVAWQKPTAENNYTWYRKYASGWVEQGGKSQQQTVSAGNSGIQVITFIVEMSDANYPIQMGAISSWEIPWATSITPKSFTLNQGNRAASGSAIMQTFWQVSGMAA